MTIHSLVHCHICPLKDFCSSGNPDASWRRQHAEFEHLREGDFEAMNKATANCPLRRAIAFVDTKLSKELLKTM